MPERTDYTTASSIALGAVFASLILFPSIFSVIKPPLVHSWAMWAFFISGISAFIFLVWTYYIATFTQDNLPVRMSGIGTISALVCLLSFAAFLFLNILQDQTAGPQISSISASAYKAEPGDTVVFMGEASDESGDTILWKWCITPVAPATLATKPTCLKSNLKSVTWRVPTSTVAGMYKVSALASDGIHESGEQLLEVHVWKK